MFIECPHCKESSLYGVFNFLGRHKGDRFLLQCNNENCNASNEVILLEEQRGLIMLAFDYTPAAAKVELKRINALLEQKRTQGDLVAAQRSRKKQLGIRL
jgi:hypothetical protein